MSVRAAQGVLHLAGKLRPGNAGSNTAADHLRVLDAALVQIPETFRHGYPILIRADGAGSTRALLEHITALHRVPPAEPRCPDMVSWIMSVLGLS